MTMAAGMGLILFIGFWLMMLASVWTVMEKAGRPGWYGIIPIWNIYQFVKIAGMRGSSMFLLLIPIVNLFFAVGMNMRLARSFGQSQGFGVGLALFPFLFLPLLAFGPAEYEGHDDDFHRNDRQGRDQYESGPYQNEDGDWVEEIPLSEW